MRVVPAPALLPVASHYVVLEEDGPARVLGAMIAVLHPNASIQYGPARIHAEAILITVAPETAFAADAPADLIYIPYVDRITWVWWSFAERMLQAHQPGRPLNVDVSAFLVFLLQWNPPPIDIVDDQIQYAPMHYYPWANQLGASAAVDLALVRARLSDDRSKRHYDVVTKGTPADIWSLYVENVYSAVQYFDYVTLKEGDVVVSIGVDEGFDTPYLLGMVGASGVVHHLDPSAEDRLFPYPRRAVAALPQAAQFHRVAVSDRVGETSIMLGANGEAYGSSMSDSIPAYYRQMMTPTTSVDAFVTQQKLTKLDLIKIDTEGAEPAILEGMIETIRTLRPQIALSIYHHLDHYWQLPLRLMELCDDYNFYVAHYSFMCWDTLIYAIPKERSTNFPYDGPPVARLIF